MTAFEHVTQGVDLAGIPPALLEPKVTASCATDDHHAATSFDATPWFSLASLDELIALWEEEYWQGETADSVAELAEWYDERVQQMFAYKRQAGQGFECAVDEQAACAWLRAHLQDVLRREAPAPAQLALAGAVELMRKRYASFRSALSQGFLEREAYFGAALILQSEPLCGKDRGAGEHSLDLALVVRDDGTDSLLPFALARALRELNEGEKDAWEHSLLVPLPSVFQRLYEQAPGHRQGRGQALEEVAREQPPPHLLPLAQAFFQERDFLSSWLLAALRERMVAYLLSWLRGAAFADGTDSISEIEVIADDGRAVLCSVKTARGVVLGLAATLE